jgi:hypothetical protein
VSITLSAEEAPRTLGGVAPVEPVGVSSVPCAIGRPHDTFRGRAALQQRASALRARSIDQQMDGE